MLETRLKNPRTNSALCNWQGAFAILTLICYGLDNRCAVLASAQLSAAGARPVYCALNCECRRRELLQICLGTTPATRHARHLWIPRPFSLPSGLVICLLWNSALAVGSEPQSILDALPTEASLGPGWKRDVTLLFDQLSRPSEIVHTNIPESFKAANRARLQDPKSAVSGWSHTHFTFQQTNTFYTYDVQIERYRDHSSN